jgi:WD domain, G-beta repeat
MPKVVAKLPLDSPLWGRLSACYSAENAIARLRETVTARQLGEAWSGLCDEILHQGSVYGVSSAAIPHLIDVAPHLPAASRRDLWVEIGFLVTAGADRFPSPPAPGLQEGLTAALGIAEALAVRDFVADAVLTPDESCYYALACVALAGHRVGRAMWQFPSASSGYIELACPACGAAYTVDGFADPLVLPCPVPAFGPTPGRAAMWRDVADAIERAGRDEVLGPGWGGFFGTARRVALAGVPAQAPPGAVWCLVAAMVATRSQAAAPWARTLARLAGHVRCIRCGRVWAIADAMADGAAAEPVDVTGDPDADGGLQGVLFQTEQDGGPADRRPGGVSPATVADGVAGFPPAADRRLAAARVAARVLWRADGDAVDALTLVAGREPAVAAGGSEGVRLRNIVSGSQTGPLLDGPAVAVASLALPEGTAVIAAAGDDGTLRWWDAPAGRPLDGAAVAGAAPVLSLAPVLMPAPVRIPAGAAGEIAGRLARFRDGRTVLAAGDADGVVRLWDPVTRAPVTTLFQRSGRRGVSLTAVNFVNQPPWNGTDLVTVYDDLLVDVWQSGSVHGSLSAMPPGVDKLAAVGHRRITGVGVSPRRLGYRRPVLLADRNGTVSMWETFGIRLSDPLPPDPAHREVTGIAVLPGTGNGITVVTASRADCNLRIWEPLRGRAALLPLTIRPRCVLTAGDALLIGHDDGLLALSLTVGTS